MTRRGKCSNYAGCLLAYRNETISVSEGELVCPECKQPLTPVSGSDSTPFKFKPVLFTVGGLVLLIVIAVVVASTGSRLKRTEPVTTTAEASPAAASTAAPDWSPAPVVTPEEPPLARPEPTAASPLPGFATSSPEPFAPKAVQPDLDLGKEENRNVKAEVLKRIDLMPTISAENKDKLYVSVERARQMGKIMTIPFGSGKTELSASDAEALKKEVESPQLQQLMRDPTAVFVILGFADTKGDEKTNLRISQARADSVLKTLRDKCGVINVMHAVGMGGSTLFDAQGAERNRVSEAWAVLP